MVRISAGPRPFRSTGSISPRPFHLTFIVDYSRLVHMVSLVATGSQGICLSTENVACHLDMLRNPAVALALRVQPRLRRASVRGSDTVQLAPRLPHSTVNARPSLGTNIVQSDGSGPRRRHATPSRAHGKRAR